MREPTAGAPPPEVRAVVEDGRLSELLDRAAAHEVLGFVHRTLRGLDGVPPEVLAELTRIDAATVARHLMAVRALEDISTILDGMAWLVMKGPVLAERVYRTTQLRPYRDLDVLVYAADVAEVVERLTAAGGRIVDRNFELLLRERRSQVHLSLPSGFAVDAHWQLVNVGRVRDDFELHAADLLARRRTIILGGRPTPTLDAVDTLLHLALHAALAGGHRLRWLKDLERVVAVECPDVTSLVERAEAAGIGAPVGLVLDRAARTVGAAIDADTIGRLSNRTALGATRRLDRLRPPPSVTSDASLPALWTRSVRGTWPATLRAMVWRSRRRAGDELLDRDDPEQRRLFLGPRPD